MPKTVKVQKRQKGKRYPDEYKYSYPGQGYGYLQNTPMFTLGCSPQYGIDPEYCCISVLSRPGILRVNRFAAVTNNYALMWWCSTIEELRRLYSKLYQVSDDWYDGLVTEAELRIDQDGKNPRYEYPTFPYEVTLNGNVWKVHQHSPTLTS